MNTPVYVAAITPVGNGFEYLVLLDDGTLGLGHVGCGEDGARSLLFEPLPVVVKG